MLPGNAAPGTQPPDPVALLGALRLPAGPGEPRDTPAAQGTRDTRETARRTAAWAADHGLFRDAGARRYAAALRVDRYTAGIAPSLRDDALAGLDRWSLWMTLVDDWLDVDDLSVVRARGAALAALLLRDDPDHGGDSAHPYVRALGDLWRDFQDRPHPWRTRLADRFVQWFESAETECRYRTARRWPSVGGYCDLRAVTIGAQGFNCVIEAYQGVAPPSRLADAGEVAVFDAVAALSLGLINDMAGIRRDLAKGDRLNLLLVIGHAEGCPLPEAAKTALGMFHDRIGHLRRLRERFPLLPHELGADPAHLPALLASSEIRLAHIRGYRDWALTSYRYHQGYDRRTPHPAGAHGRAPGDQGLDGAAS